MAGHFTHSSVSSLPKKATLVFEDFHAAILQRVRHGHTRSSLGLSRTAADPAARGKPTEVQRLSRVLCDIVPAAYSHCLLPALSAWSPTALSRTPLVGHYPAFTVSGHNAATATQAECSEERWPGAREG